MILALLPAMSAGALLITALVIITILLLLFYGLFSHIRQEQQLIIDNYGVCHFYSRTSQASSIDPARCQPLPLGQSQPQTSKQWQLLPNSRVSFFGCWLYFYSAELTAENMPVSTDEPGGFYLQARLFVNAIMGRNPHRKCILVYRDSLTAQDFSRLARIIKFQQFSHGHHHHHKQPK